MSDFLQHPWDDSLPSEIKDLIDRLPRMYDDQFRMLFNALYHLGFFSQFTSHLTSSLTFVRTTLPSALTDPHRENLLPQDIIAMLAEVKDMILFLLSIVRTTVTISVPSDELGNLCSNVLTTLNNGLCTNQAANLFVLCESLSLSFCFLLFNVQMALAHSALTNIPSELYSLLNNIRLSDLRDLDWEIDFYLTRLINSMLHQIYERLRHMNGGELGESISYSLDVEESDLEDLTVPYVYQARQDADSDSKKCSVCLVDLKDGDYARRLPCLHHFHLECIDSWLRAIRNCPLCRIPIEPTKIYQGDW